MISIELAVEISCAMTGTGAALGYAAIRHHEKWLKDRAQRQSAQPKASLEPEVQPQPLSPEMLQAEQNLGLSVDAAVKKAIDRAQGRTLDPVVQEAIDRAEGAAERIRKKTLLQRIMSDHNDYQELLRRVEKRQKKK